MKKSSNTHTETVANRSLCVVVAVAVTAAALRRSLLTKKEMQYPVFSQKKKIIYSYLVCLFEEGNGNGYAGDKVDLAL